MYDQPRHEANADPTLPPARLSKGRTPLRDHMDRLSSDLAHAFRRLVRAPGFTAIAALTLALGIGANTAIFSLVKAVVLRPLPYSGAERLVMVWNRQQDRGETTWLSGPETRDYQAQTTTFEQFAAYTTSATNLTGGMEPERVFAGVVTPNIFDALGVRALVGRAFSHTDSAAAIANDVVLGHGLWTRRFGARRDIIGQTIQVNGSARTVVGVMGPSFRLPMDFAGDRPSEMWVPLDLNLSAYASFGDHSLLGVGRRQPGVSVEQANATLRTVEQSWVALNRWRQDQVGTRGAMPLKDLVLGDLTSTMWVLLGAVAFILLIACANVANLTLARSDDRHREVAVRAALGASRSRIVSQLLTESVLLSAVGAALGVAMAFVGLRALVAVHPAGIPRVEDVGIDVGVLGFTFVLAVATGLLFGVAPAMELSRPDLNRSLKEGGRTGSVGRGRQRFRDALAVSQMAFSVVLLIGAVLLVRSFIELRRVDLGFKPESALTFRVVTPTATYAQNDNVIAFHRTFRQRLAELPGVQLVGATRILPLSGTIGDWSITIENRVSAPNENPNGDWQVVTPNYFESMGMRLVKGRTFTEADNETAPVVAVINEAMAKKYWPNRDPIGQRFHIGNQDQPWITIVGIAAQVRHNAVTEQPRTEMYVPHAQWAAAGASTSRGLTYILRTAGDPLALVGYVRQLVRSIDPGLPVADIRTLESVADDALAQPRFATQLLGLFAVLALTLAAIGIYGVISLLVTRRRQEIGIRMALGAKPGMILGLVVRRGMALSAVGVSVGLLAAALLTRAVSSLLYGVTRFDLVTFASVPAMLGAVALAACLVPASRAALMDPVRALREE
jgi:putative ABC transport system permease protein